MPGKKECSQCMLNYEIYNYDFKSVFQKSSIQLILSNKKYGKFVLLDQYGFKAIDEDIFTQLISFPKTDFIFFISSSFVKRFKDHLAVKKYFRTEEINFDESKPAECHRLIAKYFRNIIPEDKDYYLHHFTIRKKANYWGLIFGSNHSYGMEKFLKVCWKIDPLSGESNFNIDNDFEEGSLFYDPKNSNKKDELKREIKRRILSCELNSNIEGLKFALIQGCEPKLFSDVVKDLEQNGIVLRIGDKNFNSTKIHQVKQYKIEVIKNEIH
jgi:hypothetical protein